MQNIEQIEKAIDQLVDQIDGMMLRMKNCYLEQERSNG